MRRAILWLHRWLGLSVALLAVVSGVTGAALVFRPEIEARADDLVRVAIPEGAHRASPSHASPPHVPLQQVVDNVRRAYPDNAVQQLFLANGEGVAHVAWMKQHELRVYVDPYSGQVRGARQAGGSALDWLAELHIRLLSGETGHKIIGCGGLTLLAMSISGLILWWPRRGRWRNALRLHWRTNWRGRTYELHRLGGALVAPFLMLSATTGVALVWPETTQSVLGVLFGKAVRPKPKADTASGSPQPLPLDKLVARANAAFPDGEVRRIALPKKPGDPLVVRKKRAQDLHPNGMNYIYLDSISGKVLAIDDASKASTGTRAFNARYPIHIWLWGGTPTRILAIFIGLSPLLLFASGFLIWNARRKQSRKHRAK